MNFLIVVTGYNCQPLVEKCIESLRAQTYVKWTAIVISDGSTDHTYYEAIKYSDNDNRIAVKGYKKNKAAAYRRYKAIHNSGNSKQSEETVIVLLGLDDHLLPNALERIKQEYDKGKWMTYGNWVDQYGKGLPHDFELDFPEEVHAERSYRKVKYRSTAPNTFKKFLFDQIPASDFKLNGKWIDTTTESELMFSCLEMSGKERIGVIKDHIYHYNRNLPGGTLARLGGEYKMTGAEYKMHVYSRIIIRPKKPLLIREL